MGDAPAPPAPRARRRSLFKLAALVAFLLVGLSVAAAIYTDVLWFRELHASGVYRTQLWTKVALGVAFGGGFALVLALNMWIVRRITPPDRIAKIPDQILSRYRATLQPYKARAFVAIVLGGGIVAGLRAASKWREYLLWRHGGTFGSREPVFSRDAGFYVFKLPYKQAFFGWAFGALLAITIAAVVAHYLRGGIRPQRRGERVSLQARAHLSVLIGLLVALKAWGYRLDMFGLLSSRRGVVSGASYTDIHARIPALRIMIVAALVSALVILINVRVRSWHLPVFGLAFLIGVSIGGGGLYPGLIQRLKVKPDERMLEQASIRRNILATRFAYGLDRVRSTDVLAKPGKLDHGDLAVANDTIQNIRLWAPDVLRSIYQNLRRGKQYYTFPSPADTDRYVLDGGVRQLMVAAREIAPSGLGPAAQTWVNTHLFYTHGYGLVASLADEISGDGEPDFVLRDIPVQATQRAPLVKRQAIYYGETAEVPFVIARTEQQELDHPTAAATGPGYATTTYDGTGGIRMNGFWKRAALAWRFRDLNVLISGAITDQSRFMFRRAIAQRVAQVAPFVRLDANPYPVLAGDRLVWLVDGYTTAASFPYAQPGSFASLSGGMVGGSGNYIRSSVKFVVDAKDGTVDGYVWDARDPVLQAWLRIFPGSLKPQRAMPLAVRQHVRYPEGLFRIQSGMFENYHVTDAGAFYQKEDAWLVARDPTFCLNATKACGASTVPPPVPPHYMIARLPGAPGAQFVLVRPFTPSGGRQNMVGYLAANSDPADLLVYELPRQQQVFGPEQVEATINQDPIVSQQIALWNQQHSKVIYGNLIVVPVGDAMLYIQPLYLRGEGSQIPELKRIVAVADGEVRMAGTLAEAVTLLVAR
jgi:uncharacterized membrane protein (UPF0182 family)